MHYKLIGVLCTGVCTAAALGDPPAYEFPNGPEEPGVVARPNSYWQVRPPRQRQTEPVVRGQAQNPSAAQSRGRFTRLPDEGPASKPRTFSQNTARSIRSTAPIVRGPVERPARRPVRSGNPLRTRQVTGNSAYGDELTIPQRRVAVKQAPQREPAPPVPPPARAARKYVTLDRVLVIPADQVLVRRNGDPDLRPVTDAYNKNASGYTGQGGNSGYCQSQGCANAGYCGNDGCSGNGSNECCYGANSCNDCCNGYGGYGNDCCEQDCSHSCFDKCCLSCLFGHSCLHNGGGCWGPCCVPFWSHRCSVYGEYLFMTARGVDVAYATPQNGLGINAIPIDSMAVIDAEYHPGLRAGATACCGPCSSLQANFMIFESDTTNAIALPGGTGFVAANLTHPNTQNVAADSLSARAALEVGFAAADANFRWLIRGNDCLAVNGVLGFRYASLWQELNAEYNILGPTAVDSDVDFRGFGPRLGFDVERRFGQCFVAYGRVSTSFLFGEIDADYLQTNVFAGRQAQIGWTDNRIIPQIEMEVGLSWRNDVGNIRVFAGYHFQAWLNALNNRAWINGIQRNDLTTDMEETISFDGLTGRVELLF